MLPKVLELLPRSGSRNLRGDRAGYSGVEDSKYNMKGGEGVSIELREKG
jgi:hypothetical protein